MDEELIKNLLKKATGYTYDEISEEYSVDDAGQIVLSKRKVTTKYCPPDATALKTYLELIGDKDLCALSDEELKKEKNRLLLELKEANKESEK